MNNVIRVGEDLLKINVAVMQDIQGPKIRTGVANREHSPYRKVNKLTLTNKEV